MLAADWEGRPLIGQDNKPLRLALGPDHSPLGLGRDGEALKGPDGRPIIVALSPENEVVALTADGRPLQGAGCDQWQAVMACRRRPFMPAAVPGHRQTLACIIFH